MTPFEFGELVEGYLWREEAERRRMGWGLANILNALRGKRSSRITVDKVCGGPPKWTKEDSPRAAKKLKPEKRIKPGEARWKEFIEDFPEDARKRILERGAIEYAE